MAKPLTRAITGFGTSRIETLQLFNWKSDHAASIISAVMRGLIPSGAKGLFAGAGQNDRRHRFVPTGPGDRMDQLLAGHASEGIVFVRMVDGDPYRRAAGFVEDVRVFHVSHPCMVSPPDTLMVWPVMKLASSLARNATMPGRSAGWPRRLSGMAF